MPKSKYHNRCGSCRFCDLTSVRTYAHVTLLTCTRNLFTVGADKEACMFYEEDRERSGEELDALFAGQGEEGKTE